MGGRWSGVARLVAGDLRTCGDGWCLHPRALSRQERRGGRGASECPTCEPEVTAPGCALLSPVLLVRWRVWCAVRVTGAKGTSWHT